MPIIAKRAGTDFIPAPSGSWPAICVDVVDMGEIVNEWRGEKQHKVRIVWQISERMPDGKPFLVQRRYTLSLHEKSNLRKDLASWRGRDFTAQELEAFDVENVVGAGCLLSVMQQLGMDGQMYSNVIAVMRLPQGYEPPRPDGYVRVIHRPESQPQQLASQPRVFRQAPVAQPALPPPGPGPAYRVQAPPDVFAASSVPPAHDAGMYPPPVEDDDVPF
jgi:hypothetical protein